jgi:hypothetical protein
MWQPLGGAQRTAGRATHRLGPLRFDASVRIVADGSAHHA